MSEVLRGPLRAHDLTQASGAGGDITLSIRPPAGEVWDLFHLRCTHDDAAGLTVQWRGIDTAGGENCLLSQGTSVPRYLFTDLAGCKGGLRINNDCYIGFKVNGMAGAKTISANVLYERITGVQPWESL